MEQVEMNNTTINRVENNGSEKWTEKNTEASDKLIKAVHGTGREWLHVGPDGIYVRLSGRQQKSPFWWNET